MNGNLLPEGWSCLKFGALFTDAQNGCGVRQGTGQPTVVLRLADVSTSGSVATQGLRSIPLSPEAQRKYALAVGDLIAFRVNGSAHIAGQIITYPGPAGAAYCDHFIRFRVEQHIALSRFVSLAFRTPVVRKQVEEKMVSSAGQNTVSQASFREIQIPLPPIAEQRRIVAQVEALLAKVRSCQERLDTIPTVLKRFRHAILAAACSGKLTTDWRQANGRDEITWRDAQLADVCSSIADGDHQPPPQRKEGVPFLTIRNVATGGLDFSNTRFVPEDYFATIKPHRTPTPGDVLYTVVATIGVAVLVETDRPFCFQRHIAILKPNQHISSRYLRILLASPSIVNEARSRATGTAQPTVALGRLRSIPVEIPPRREQDEIVRRVDSMLALADRLEARHKKAKAQIDRLTQSVLAKAFRGELVTTEAELARCEGRDYETAEELLARVTATRTTRDGRATRGPRGKNRRGGV